MKSIVRLTQIDGKLPNLALMKIARVHRERGDEIHFTKHVERDMFEPSYERVYGSAIFSFSAARVVRFREQFPNAIVDRTGGFKVCLNQGINILAATCPNRQRAF